VTQFILHSLSYDLACRLSNRHGLKPSKKDRDWELAEKARALYKTVESAPLAALIFEAMLLAPVGNTRETKDDPLTAAALYNVDVKATRRTVAKEENEREQKRKIKNAANGKTTPKGKISCK
jgi:hypothetical protein